MKIEPIEFTVTAEHKVEWSDEARTDLLTSLNGDVTTGEIELRPVVGGAIRRRYNPETGTGFWDFEAE